MDITKFLNKQNNNLDLARIILACLVIVGHSEAINGSGNYWIDPVRHFIGFTYSGAFAVKLFFFISGLVVTNSYLSKNDAIYFVFSRIFRIMPALIFVLIITVFVFGVVLTKLSLSDYFSELNYFSYIRHNILFYTDYILPGVFNDNLYPNIVNGSLWSLRYEVGCYIVLFFLFLLLNKGNRNYFIIPILLIFVDSLLPSRFILKFIDNNPEKYLLPLSFAYGAFFAIFADKIKINIYTTIGSILLFLLAKNTQFAEVILIFTSCNVLVYLFSLRFVIKLKPKHDISYGIYLWGFLIQQTIFYYFGSMFVGLHCLFAVLVSIFLALITFIYIEKPFIKIGKSVIDYVNNSNFKIINRLRPIKENRIR